ncbi:MAG: hypothetical protein OXE40_10490, partial [Gammaproteobacteria bacterium]|nr:hypothetical protein [Gammaproteobacteria bacterium]
MKKGDRKRIQSKASMLWLAAAWLLLVTQSATALEFDARIKAFGTVAALPSHDVQRVLDESPALDANFDLRLMFRENAGPFEFIVDHSITMMSGDSFAFLNAPGATLDQTPAGDAGRAFDLSWEIEDGSRHRSLHRFDRLAVRYRRG